MKTLTIIAVIGALALCGCSSIKYERVMPDGTKVTATANSVLQKRQGVKAADGNGATFAEESVAGDVQMVKAIGDLVIKAMAAGASGVATGGAAPAIGAVLPAIVPSSAPVAPAPRTLTIKP